MPDLTKDQLIALLLRRNHLYALYPDGCRLMLEKKVFDQSVNPSFGYQLSYERVGMTKRGEIYRASESVEYFKTQDVEKAVDAYVSRKTNSDHSVITYKGCSLEEILEYCLV